MAVQLLSHPEISIIIFVTFTGSLCVYLWLNFSLTCFVLPSFLFIHFSFNSFPAAVATAASYEEILYQVSRGATAIQDIERAGLLLHNDWISLSYCYRWCPWLCIDLSVLISSLFLFLSYCPIAHYLSVMFHPVLACSTLFSSTSLFYSTSLLYLTALLCSVLFIL